MKNLKELHQLIMEFYHKRILEFYLGQENHFDLLHMNFDDLNNPKMIFYDGVPGYIGRIEVDDEGISNIIHDTPLTIGCQEKCETLSMQDFVICGRLPSISTIRQMSDDNPQKKFYVYQTVNGQKGERQEIFPILRSGQGEASFMLRGHINRLLSNEVHQLVLNKKDHKAEMAWIQDNNKRFEDVCQRLQLVMFKDVDQLTIMNALNVEEEIHYKT